MFTLSELRAYNTDHIIDHAAVWDRWAAASTQTWTSVLGDAAATTYTGSSAETMHATLTTHADSADGQAGALQAAAADARNAAATLTGAAKAVLSAVDQITGQGFEVSENWTVSDPTTDPYARAARAADLVTAQSTLGTLLSQFIAAEQATGVMLGGHAATVAGDLVTPDWPSAAGKNAVPRWPYPMPPTNPPARPWPAPGDKFHPWPGTPPGDSTNWPNPATDFQGYHHGGNFNPGVKLDTSTSSVAPPIKPDDGWRSGFLPNDPMIGGGGRFIVGQTNGFKTAPALPLPPPVPPGAPVNNGPTQTPWPPAGGVPPSVANPHSSATPPQVISTAPAEPPLKDCTPQDYARDLSKIVGGAAAVVGGGAGMFGGIVGLPETAGASAAAIAGGAGIATAGGSQIIDGITDWENCK